MIIIKKTFTFQYTFYVFLLILFRFNIVLSIKLYCFIIINIKNFD